MNTNTELISMNLCIQDVTVPFSVEASRDEVIHLISLGFLAKVAASSTAIDDLDFWRDTFFNYKQLEMEYKMEGKKPFLDYSHRCDSENNVIRIDLTLDTDNGQSTYTFDECSFLDHFRVGSLISPYLFEEQEEFLDFFRNGNIFGLNFALYMRVYGIKDKNNGYEVLQYGIRL